MPLLTEFLEVLPRLRFLACQQPTTEPKTYEFMITYILPMAQVPLSFFRLVLVLALGVYRNLIGTSSYCGLLLMPTMCRCQASAGKFEARR